jgi:hypothetical protein
MRFLILLFLFLNSCSSVAYSQDSILITVEGKVWIDSLEQVAREPEIKIFTTFGKTYHFKGDSSGKYRAQFKAPDTNFTATFLSHSDKSNPYNRFVKNQIHYNSESGKKHFSKTIHNQPQMICNDSFLPRPLYFEFNESEKLKENYDQVLINWVIEFGKNAPEYFETYKIKIIGYESFSEDDSIGYYRARYIKNLLDSASDKHSAFISYEGKADYFLCTHCDGCNYFYKAGKGIHLTDSLINNADELKRRKLNKMRQMVNLRWVLKEE